MKSSRFNTPKRPAKRIKGDQDPIEVYCRIRPLFDEEQEVCVKIENETTVVLIPPEAFQSSNGRASKELHYSFTHVFDENTSQKNLFDHVGLPLVNAALHGNNGLLFTYGISSSGKTYTMEGTPRDGGLLPRSLDVIFNSIKDVQAQKYLFKPDRMNGFDIQSVPDALVEQKNDYCYNVSNKSKAKNKKVAPDRIPDSTVIKEISSGMCYSVFVSYVEIYNNYIYDLLDESLTISKTLHEDASNNVFISGVLENEVRSVDEALDLFYRGQDKRRTAHTALNAESSRSHGIFTIRIVQAPLDYRGDVLVSKENLIISQLSLVDLAGSERSVRTKNTGHKLREAGNINSSLMTLKKCIESLRMSQTKGINKMVPYRESKLTHLFKTFFEGEGKLSMIVCINPHVDNYKETINVMQFAEMTRDVKISRPNPTPLIPGFRGGHGILYQDSRASEHLVVYSLGPEFPQLIIESSDDESMCIKLYESMCNNLNDFLEARISRRKALNRNYEYDQAKFRENLMVTENENYQLKHEKERLEMDLEIREQQLRNLEQKLCSVEETIDGMQKHIDEYKRKAQNASYEVNEKERMLAECEQEMERMKAKMKEEKASMKRQMKELEDEKVAAVERERKMISAVKQLKDIINAEQWDEYFADINLPRACIPSSTGSESSEPVTQRKRISSDIEEFHRKKRFSKARSTSDVHSNNNPSVPAPSQSSNNVTCAQNSKENKAPVATPSTKSIAVANPRHRRSTSAGNWIEHKPVGNLELTTVLQPAMKKKKSVSKLEVKDVTNSEKYVLQHQEQDSHGEVETQLFKGDIVPSTGGGAQVIFNDVEKLHQVSPTPVYNLRKRSGEKLPLKEIEERCTISVNCHGLPPKVMKK